MLLWVQKLGNYSCCKETVLFAICFRCVQNLFMDYFQSSAWLHQLSLGYDDETVTPRQLPKSIGCCKMFNGPEALKTKDKVKFWINQLATEVVERVQRDLEMVRYTYVLLNSIHM